MAVTDTLNVPASVGVPASVPELVSVSPAGRVPAESANEYGATPPLADNAWVYTVPAVEAGSVAGVNVNVGAATSSVYARRVV